MTVKELIAELEKMPQDRTVIMFDGPSYFTPSKVYKAEDFFRSIKDKVVID